MRFDRIRDVLLTDPSNGTTAPIHRVIDRRVLLLLVGARQPRLDRAAVEIAWMMERLPAGSSAIMIWPPELSGGAIDVAFPASIRLFRDGSGALQHLVPHGDGQVVLLADPHQDSLEIVTINHDLFTIAREQDADHCRGTDRTVDLGDMHF